MWNNLPKKIVLDIAENPSTPPEAKQKARERSQIRAAAFAYLNFIKLSADIKSLEEDPRYGFPQPIVSFLSGIKDDPEYAHVIRWVATKLYQDSKQNFKTRKSQMWEGGTAKEELPKEIDFRIDSEYMRDGDFFYKVKAISDWAKQNKVDVGSFSIEQATDQAKQWQRQLGEQAASQEAQLEAQRQRLGNKEYIDDGVYIVPIRPLEYINTPENFQTLREECEREGDELNHCVATYAEQLADKSTDLYSVRLDSGERVGTIEIENGQVEQIKGYDDGPLPDEVHSGVRAWLHKHNLQFSKDGRSDLINVYNVDEARKDLFSGDPSSSASALRHPEISSLDINKLYFLTPSLHPKVIAQIARHSKTNGAVIDNIYNNFLDDANIALGLALYPPRQASEWDKNGPFGGGDGGALKFYKQLFSYPNKRVSEAAKKNLVKLPLLTLDGATRQEIINVVGIDSLKDMIKDIGTLSEDRDITKALIYLNNKEIDKELFKNINPMIANSFVNRATGEPGVLGRGRDPLLAEFSDEQWKDIVKNISKFPGGAAEEAASIAPKNVLHDLLSSFQGRNFTHIIETLLKRDDLDGSILGLIVDDIMRSSTHPSYGFSAEQLILRVLNYPGVLPETWKIVINTQPEWASHAQNAPPEVLRELWDMIHSLKAEEALKAKPIIHGLLKNKNTPPDVMNSILKKYRVEKNPGVPDQNYSNFKRDMSGLLFNKGLSEENEKLAFEMAPLDDLGFLTDVFNILKSNSWGKRHPGSVVVHENVEAIGKLLNKFLEVNKGKLTPIKMKFFKNQIYNFADELERRKPGPRHVVTHEKEHGAAERRRQQGEHPGVEWLENVKDNMDPRFRDMFPLQGVSGGEKHKKFELVGPRRGRSDTGARGPSLPKEYFRESSLAHRSFKVAAYNRKISSVQEKQDLAIEETIARYALYPKSLLELIPNEDTEFREQFDQLVPSSIVNSLEGMNERMKSLQEGLVNYQNNPDWIEKSFYEIQEYFPSIELDLPNVERQLNRFRNTDFYPKYIISAVTKLLSSLQWLKQWLFQLFQFLLKIIQ